MKELKEHVYDRLAASSELLELLELNPPYFDKGLPATKVASILPSGQATGETNAPFITIAGGPEVQIGEMFFNGFFYVRAFAPVETSYVLVDDIIKLVKGLLDKADLELEESVQVRCRFDETSTELYDQAFNLNYREATFRVEQL